MSTTVSIKCPECGTINYNRDYCRNCGSIINVQLKRKIAQEKKTQQKLQEKKKIKPGKLKNYVETALDHPNIFVKLISKTIYAVWAFLGILIGGFIAVAIGIASG